MAPRDCDGTGHRSRMNTVAQLDRTLLLCRDYVQDGLSNEAIATSFVSCRVLCVGDGRNLATHSGQTCLSTLVGLLSRMGIRVALAIPEASLILPQPPFAGGFLRESLLASSNRLVPGAEVEMWDGKEKPDLIFILGDSRAEESGSAWRLGGSDWGGVVERSGMVPRWTGHWPVGGMVSATLAAGETFKYAMGRLPFRNPEDQIFFEPSSSASWEFDSLGSLEKTELGEVDIVSAGAISQAALYALVRIPNLRMRGRVFDDDTTEETNLNRNMLSLVGDIGLMKASLVAGRCSPNCDLLPIQERFGLGDRVEELAPLVLVGVDDIPSRWAVQRNAPGVVIVSGTSHFSISSSCHGPGGPCCGCQHPVDDAGGATTIPTVSFVSFWAGLAMTVRLIRRAMGRPYPRNRQHLWLTPLRMDLSNAAMWSSVFPRGDCPVGCFASRVPRWKARASGRCVSRPRPKLVGV